MPKDSTPPGDPVTPGGSAAPGGSVAYVRAGTVSPQPPPPSQSGAIGWVYRHVIGTMINFSTPGAAASSLFTILLTVILLWFGLGQLYGLAEFMLIDAVWSDPRGIKRLACATVRQGGALPAEWSGACWPYVSAKWQQYVYGKFPDAEIWRVNILYALGAAGLAWLILPRTPRKGWVGLFMLTVYPVLAFILLTGAALKTDASGLFWGALGLAALGLGRLGATGRGGAALEAFAAVLTLTGWALLGAVAITFLCTLDYGLEPVETSLWGGLLVTLVVALTGIVASLPLGVLLALGRRSALPIIRTLSVAFIEFWRGVPLITVLFMASVMLPLFLPEGVDFNKLLRALVGVALFSSAYMAEVVRGGLQAIPKGQYEGAQSLGLPYWRMMRLIIMPQALTLVIPGIVNTFIGLFKDTTLVLIIGLFDLLGAVQSTFTDSSWATPVTSPTGYLVVAAIFWLFCFGMSRYSVAMERKLHRGHKH